MVPPPAARGSRRGLILLLELFPTVPNIGQFIIMPRQGLLTIASVLRQRTDYRVRLIFEPYVGAVDLDEIASDPPRAVLVNGLTTSADVNQRFISRLRARLSEAIPVIAGGEHAAMYPEDTRRYADYIIANEGDTAILQLLAAIDAAPGEEREALLRQIPGLQYRDAQGRWQHGAGPARVQAIDYRYDLSVMPGARNANERFGTAYMPLQTARGCRYHCTFCSWIRLFGGKGYHLRPIDDVIHDLRHTIEHTGIYRFIVSDNLFAGDQAYTEALMRAILSAFAGQRQRPQLTALCRADQFIDHPRALPASLIALMARAGLTTVSLGLESISGTSLELMRKGSHLGQVLEASARLRAHGINLLGTFVAGFDGDTEAHIHNIAEFGERAGLFTIQIYARNITPGTTDAARSSHRYLPGNLTKFRNGHSVNFLPLQMRPSTLQRAIFDATFRFHRADERRQRTLQAFELVWAALAPHLRALERIERDILIPEKIYLRAREGWRLDDPALLEMRGDPQRDAELTRRCQEIFRAEDGAEATTPVKGSSHAA